MVYSWSGNKFLLLKNGMSSKCSAARKLVITVTQTLESMIQFPLPTRAETVTTDVSNTVLENG